MYSSGYSQVSKSSQQAKKKMQYRSKGKSCGYYMRIVFFFSSLIQSLIIVSLVLFLVYGKTQDSASTSRVQDLEESFSRLSIENVALRQQRKNLTNLLNTTLTEKARNDWDLAKLRYFANISSILIHDMDRKLQQSYSKLIVCESAGSSARCATTFQVLDRCNCGLMTEQLKAGLELVESNFTQTVQRMRMELDQTAKERDSLNLEVIHLRRDKATHEKEVDFFKQKCKDDFSQSLSGISNVSKAFLEKINSLFPSHIAFQLTCPKQREHLEQIRTNCTSLSMEVEDRLQRYLNVVGEQVSGIQAENSRMKAENWRLSEDYRWCSMNRTGLLLQHRQDKQKLQGKHDEDKERLLMDKMRLNGEIEVLHNNVKYKSKAIDHLTEQIKQLNMSCMSKTGFGVFPGGSTGTQSQPGWGVGGSTGQLGRLSPSHGSFGSALNKPGSTGTGSSSSSVLSAGSGSSFGSAFNKPGSTGTGSSSSSVSSAGSGSSFGSAFNKPGSTGTGSSSSSVLSAGSGSSFGSAFNKPGSTGTGSSTGFGYNKPGSTGAGSSSSSVSSAGSGSSFGSAFNKPGSTGTGSSTGFGYNKPGSTGAGSSSSSVSSAGSGSSFGSAFNKPGSTGTGSSTGFGYNKPGSTGAGSSSSSVLSAGSGSSFGSAFNKPGSTGTGSSTGLGLNKPGSSVKSTSGIGSSSGSTGSTGSTNKSGSTNSGFSWFGNSNSGQSKTGSGTGRGPSPGHSGGTGSSFDAGRTSGLGGGSISVAQHLKDLQRIINPSGPEEKQDLSRMLG